jgi:2-desacetyl-2-hydroxyethyl bacteriochlorophyllide A dehydrogenase
VQDRMLAAVFAGPGVPVLEERVMPRLERPTDVVLDVEACGVCGTDLQILADPPGHPAAPGVILGHEFVGIVAETGADVEDLPPGTRVVVAPNLACGHCAYCRRGLRNHCLRFTTLGIFRDGGLAARVVVPAEACHPISPAVPVELAALVEPLSTVVHGVARAKVFPGETVAVLGAGPVGLMFVALLRLAGATVVAVEPAAERAELARRLGADRVVDPEDAASAVQEATGGLGADAAVDAVGTQLPAALGLVRKAGRIVLFGMNAGATAELAQYPITRNELTVAGAYVGEGVFPRAIALLEQGRLDLEPLITDRIALAQLPDAIERMRAGHAVKVQVELG